MAGDVLTYRELNRATLARQLLLERSTMTPLAAVEHLVGLQAQNPRDPYLALWSRLADFDPDALGRLLEERHVVRIVVMRGTVHLVSAGDALELRQLMQPVLDAELSRHSEFAPRLVGVDVKPVLEFACAALADTPLNGVQLRAVLAERFPEHHAPALAYACRCLHPLVQIPPRGVWGRTMQVTLTPLEAWVGQPVVSDASIDHVVLRYLAAFGPAGVADVASWSRLTGMREVLERLRPGLRAFRSPKGQELFDLPDAPRPDADIPAPVRFLPEYDNLLLSHADRSRFGTDENRRFTSAVGPFKGSVLVDGEGGAIWHIDLDRVAKHATLVVEHHPMPRRVLAAVQEEGKRVAEFWEPRAQTHAVRLLTVKRSA
jgi:Winged helix DNA-binding domain